MKENSWKNIFRAIPLPCVVLKPQSSEAFIIVDANQAYLDLVNRPLETLINKQGKEAFPPNPDNAENGYEVIAESFKQVLRTGKKHAVKGLRYDLPIAGTDRFEERFFDSENIPLKGDQEQVEFILHAPKEVFLNPDYVNREKQMLAELNISRQTFRNFVSGNPDGLYRLDLEGNFIHANESLAKMAEIPLHRLLGMNFKVFCAPAHEKRIEKNFKKASEGKITSFEADYVTERGRYVTAKMLLMPMFVEGKVREIHGIAKDITEIKRTEKVILEKSRFLEVSAIFITSLLENDIDDEALRETFGVIAQTVEADRMYYFSCTKPDENGEILISQRIEWCDKNIQPQIDNRNMQQMPMGQVKEIMTPLIQNLPFTAKLRELSNGGLKKTFRNQSIKSMLLLPILLQDQLYGFVGFDDCKRERTWTEEEIKFLRSLTQNLTNAFEKKAALEKVSRQEEELRQSEQKFRALVQEGSDLIGILDKNGVYSFVSESYKKILGYRPEELISQDAYDFIHQEDWPRIKAQFEQLEYHKQVNISAFRFRDKSGTYKWIESTATNLLQDSAVEGIVVNSRDVSTIVEQAREIEHINERYLLAATATRDLIFDWDLTRDQVMRFHKGTEELFGYPAEEFNQKHFWQKNIHPEDFTVEKKRLEKVLAAPGESFIKTEYRFKRADGSYARVVDKGYILRDNNGKATRLIGATIDVSEISDKREALKIANKRFKMAMKATNEMIWDWEIETDSVTRSKGYKSIFGYDTNQATSVHAFWLTKVAPEDQAKIKASLEKVLQNPRKKKWKLEYRFIKADGTTAYVVDRGYILRDKDGKAIRMIGSVLDVSNSRELLRRVQRQNRILKEIAWEQSHIVRAPLARIQGLLNLLEENAFEDMAREEVLFHLKSSADELDEIVRNIVGKTEQIDVELA